jgi:hypothetical protein
MIGSVPLAGTPQGIDDPRSGHEYSHWNPNAGGKGITGGYSFPPDPEPSQRSRWCLKDFDAQMLLDPFEEQFHTPACLVEMSDGKRV